MTNKKPEKQRKMIYCKGCGDLLEAKGVLFCVVKASAVKDVLGDIVDVRGVKKASEKNKLLNCKDRQSFSDKSARELKRWMLKHGAEEDS